MAQFVYFAYSSTPEPRMLTRFLILSCVNKWNFILVYKDNIREMSAFRRLSLNPLQRDRCRGTANPLAGEKKHPVCRSTEPSCSGTGGGCPSYILTRDELQDQLFGLLRTGISSPGSWRLGLTCSVQAFISQPPQVSALLVIFTSLRKKALFFWQDIKLLVTPPGEFICLCISVMSQVALRTNNSLWQFKFIALCRAKNIWKLSVSVNN